MQQQPCAKDTAVLIPSYKPDDRLAAYVQHLLDAGFAQILVVDDGSGEAYRPFFEKLPKDARVLTLHYEPNCGKGVALRRGMEHLWNECPDCAYVITADSDGQHTPEDVLRMSESLHENSAGLMLGTRNFAQSDVPFKSRAGNRITSTVFLVLYGQWVSDTQTGLRGFARGLLPTMIAVKGDRYEYEMNMLIVCAAGKIPIRALPIQTVYEDNNAGSHFRAVRDSARIYKVIFTGFFKFISSSAISFFTDYGLYLLFNNLLKAGAFPSLEKEIHLGLVSLMPRIVLAIVLARLISGAINFFLNKQFVFGHNGSTRKSFAKYLCVFFLVMFLSAALTSSLHLWLGWSENSTKIPVDLALFFLSYQMQRRWVFVEKVPRD